MGSLTEYEEMAIAIQTEFEDELDNTNTDEELLSVAKEAIRELLPEAEEIAIISISEEILKIYQPVDEFLT